MPLKTYRAKRDFARTKEPTGAPRPRARSTAGKPLSFVVQKHDASRLHYDFRLELDGALLSWAVPKGPSLDPADKRLAVHVEDHPLEYAAFEGTIPEGEYGGGTVMVWDRGTWTPEDDPKSALRAGRLSFTLDGEKLKGRWTLTRLGTSSDRVSRRGASRNSDRRDQWLLIKRRDRFARSGGRSLLDSAPRSVATGRTLEQIAAGEKPPPRSARAREPMPGSIAPQLCTLVEHPPAGDEWLHEVKIDGFRLIVRKDERGTRLITRGKKDWTDRFREVADAVDALPQRRLIMDGEVTVLDAKGRSSFQRLQNALAHGAGRALVLFVFDLLYVDGEDLRSRPQLERTERLRQLLPANEKGVLRLSEHIPGDGDRVYEHACRLGLEGVVSKRQDAPYVSQRSRYWLKSKCSRRQEFVIVGWTDPANSREHFGALLLGAHDRDGRLVYTGRVGTGFDRGLLADIKRRLEPHERSTCPTNPPPTRAESRGVHWVEPRLVAEVNFTEWTDDRRLRHPSFEGLREDKEAKNVVIEVPVEDVPAPGNRRAASRAAARTAARTPAPAARRAAESSAPAARRARGATAPRRKPAERGKVVSGVTITHPDRVVYPGDGITKLEVARYYETVAPWMLPFIVDRPLSVVRCPGGREAPCFFQKHMASTFKAPVKAMRVREEAGVANAISIDSVEGLISLIQFGVLEIHPWGAPAGDPEHAEIVTFDLDPGEGVRFDEVKQAALDVRERLERDGLVSHLKTTGGKGLHVVVPIAPSSEWNASKAYARSIAGEFARLEPERFIAKASKAARQGRIFIDYLRNGRGATAIAPYSTRARPGAPVAAPLRWSELDDLTDPSEINMSTMADRLRRLRSDPWTTPSRSQVLPRATPAVRRRSAQAPSTRSAASTSSAKRPSRGRSRGRRA